MLKHLNTPLKRVGGLVLVVGVTLVVVGLLIMLDDGQRHMLREWWEAILQERHAYRRYWILAWGSYLVAAGFTLSFAYDRGLGRVVKWVQHGTVKGAS